MNADEGLEAYRAVLDGFAGFVADRGRASEADTRVKVIDRVLVDVLGWPERDIAREYAVSIGYIDYSMNLRGKPYIVVEAKREGITFTLPVGETARRGSLSGALMTGAAVSEAIQQVRSYCDDYGVRYAVATNGYTWIVFRAVRDDMPWRRGQARVFASPDAIVDGFTDFWNLLSYEAICSGSLEDEFGSPHRVQRQLHRVLDTLFNSDLPLERNRLDAKLAPLIRAIFEDIGDHEQLEVLRRCYVHSGSLRIAINGLGVEITDQIPQVLRRWGVTPLHQGAKHGGALGATIAEGVRLNQGRLLLLLGGIGSGKTTFLKRYQRTVGKPVLDSTIWFHVDFLGAPTLPEDSEPWVWAAILEQLRGRYGHLNLETRHNLKRAFADEIKSLTGTALLGLRQGTESYEDALTPYLLRWQEDRPEYVSRLLRLCQARRQVAIVMFIDNVDQLSPEHQARIFLLAQGVTRKIGTTTVIALREETYYTASVQRSFTAYTNRKFHIASPHFRGLISSRIDFALDLLEKGSPEIPEIAGIYDVLDRTAIADFLRIVRTSIFEQNRNIARFIEAVCFGNMRRALDMFATFLVSGASNVDKMLGIYEREGAYFVAFHEFLKSIMLGDRRYYKEESSFIMNLLNCTAEKNSSHFTTLRLLRLLLAHRGESTREGEGYFEISRVIQIFEDVFDNTEDVIRTMNVLLRRQLMEANSRSTESINEATHVRVTSAGWYYPTFLVASFGYLDLVLQDTPLDDPVLRDDLVRAIRNVDNLDGRTEQKLERLSVRFARVERFLHYLEAQENAEVARYRLGEVVSVVAGRFMPEISSKYFDEKEWIAGRLRDNREKDVADFLYSDEEEIAVDETDDTE